MIKHYWQQMTAEEKANTLTHLLPFLATLCLAPPLILQALRSSYGALGVVGTALFLLGALQMFGASTAYHAAVYPAIKARLRVFDHISIYVMIAGSYSLICLCVVGGWAGWTLFAFLWACVIAGAVGKIVALGRFPRLSLTLYLMMGWVALLILWPMWLHMPHPAFWWIIAEGVFYTVGSYFFNHDEEHAFYHALWHVFITLGALSHTVATWIILN